MTGPAGAVPFSPNRAAILVAVLYQRHPTVRTVAEYAGVNVQTAHRHLRRLRELGLIDFEDGCAGTLHPLVEVVPLTEAATA